MIACFLKKVHEQNQKKIGKNMVFWSCTLSVICAFIYSRDLKIMIIEGKVSPMEQVLENRDRNKS